MPTVVTTWRRRHPASWQACPNANRGGEPRSGASVTQLGAAVGFLGPLFNEVNGNRALDAPVLAMEATG
jgi:hypothetical protein